MKNHLRIEGRPVLPALFGAAVAAAALVAGAAGVQPPRADAARAHKAHFERPRLTHGELIVRGTNGSDSIALRLEAGDPNVIQVDLNDDGSPEFSFGRARVRRIVVDARSGDDHVRIDDSNGAFTDGIPTAIFGGDGNDKISGGAGAELLIGGDGNDAIDGSGGADTALLGSGDDTFSWDPGDGSDRIEGQDGTDTMLFDGGAGPDTVDVSANGSRLRFFRNPGNITMDTRGVERVNFKALGGADTVTVNDLSGTDVQNVNLDLAGTFAAASGTDRVTVNGTNRNESINVSGDASGVAVTGLRAQVAIQHQDPTDQLTVNGLGGNDTISATGLAAGAIIESLDGGDGNDSIAGGAGNEALLGESGSDTIDGNGGADTALLGAGGDTFVWDPGDGSDAIEGGDGTDTMVFNGGAGADTVDASANGNHLRFFRNPGNVTMDTHGVERVLFNALGGADAVTVHDLSGTGVSSVDLDLAGSLGGSAGDGSADHVTVDGTNGNDSIGVVSEGCGVKVSGLAATVELLHAEAADRLDVETLAGLDTVDSAGLAAGSDRKSTRLNSSH